MSKKSERITKIIQLRNTFEQADKMGNPASDKKLTTFTESEHNAIIEHIDSMLLDEGIHKVNA